MDTSEHVLFSFQRQLCQKFLILRTELGDRPAERCLRNGVEMAGAGLSSHSPIVVARHNILGFFPEKVYAFPGICAISYNITQKNYFLNALCGAVF